VIDHITIRASDRAASEAFYDTVLMTIGIERSGRSDEYTVWRGQFSLAAADNQHPVTRGLHIGFGATSRELVALLDPDGNSVEAVHHDAAAGGVIDHLSIGVRDLQAAKEYYERVAPFGGFRLTDERPDRVTFTSPGDSFSLVATGEPTENLHIAFETHDNATVDAFHRELTGAGYTDNGPPGERGYHPGYYGAFLFDPDGNNVEVVNHNR
jgi:catechol 2,3-dioxygenase-like lactoylglutathione lyase family enzyme